MSHIDVIPVDVAKVSRAEPLHFEHSLERLMWLCITVASGLLGYAFMTMPHAQVWSAFYFNLIFWMGLTVGGCMIAVILQLAKAKWAQPIRRLAEGHIVYLPYLWCLVAFTYIGKESLFYWGSKPMPGREWWMQPEFVYGRNLLVLGILFFMLTRFVKMALRRDVGIAREVAGKNSRWGSSAYDALVRGWRGGAEEIACLNRKMAYFGPVVVFCYAIFYSLFAFDMIMGMDSVFFANMFGGFVFIGNIYAGWAMLSLLMINMRKKDPVIGSHLTHQQFWDIGKLMFGFAILWAYLFFSHFMPIWYGNLPEETQWIIVRLRENPWRLLSWSVLGMCFVLPFIVMLSRDVKKNPFTLGCMACIILTGLWLERYILIMPQVSPGAIPFGYLELAIALGFLGGYVLSIQHFLTKYPTVSLTGPTDGVPQLD